MANKSNRHSPRHSPRSSVLDYIPRASGPGVKGGNLPNLTTLGDYLPCASEPEGRGSNLPALTLEAHEDRDSKSVSPRPPANALTFSPSPRGKNKSHMSPSALESRLATLPNHHLSPAQHDHRPQIVSPRDATPRKKHSTRVKIRRPSADDSHSSTLSASMVPFHPPSLPPSLLLLTRASGTHVFR
jgi:hypothetical protein